MSKYRTKFVESKNGMKLKLIKQMLNQNKNRVSSLYFNFHHKNQTEKK